MPYKLEAIKAIDFLLKDCILMRWKYFVVLLCRGKGNGVQSEAIQLNGSERNHFYEL